MLYKGVVLGDLIGEGCPESLEMGVLYMQSACLLDWLSV